MRHFWIWALASAFHAVFTTVALGQNTIACDRPYTVAPGDTLAVISLRAYGESDFRPLYQANLTTIGPDPNRLSVGQVLAMPCRGTADAPSATAEVETETALPAGGVLLTFNKTSAPPFILNKNMIDRYLDEITTVTEGRVRFVDPEVMNQDEAAQFALVTSGEVDGAYVLNSYLAETHPLLQLPMLPLMGGSAEQTATTLWNLHVNYLARTGYFDQAKLLGFVAAPAAHIWRATNSPVRADEGIAYANRYPVPYFLGLDQRGPVVLREEVSALQAQHAAQYRAEAAYFLAHGAARAVGIWTPDVTVTEVDNGLYTPTYSVVLSNEAWGRISPQDQAAIEAISGERLAARSASWDAFDNGFRRDMLEKGLRFIKASPALTSDLQEAADEGIKAWTAEANAMGIPADAAIAAYLEDLRALEDRLIFR